jgi:hypothetical protein
VREGTPNLNHGRASVRHAGSLYGKTFGWLLKPIRRVEAEAHHLHEVEQHGASGETPLIAILGLLLFLGPIFVLMLGLALLAAHLAG